MAADKVMKNYFARFVGHEMMSMVFSSDFHGIFTNLSFIVIPVHNIPACTFYFCILIHFLSGVRGSSIKRYFLW